MTKTKIVLPLLIAAAVTLAAGTAVAVTAPSAATGTVNATVPVQSDDQVTQCLTGQDVPNPGEWRAAAKIDADAPTGFLVIRTDKTAAVCVLENGKGTGLMGGYSKDLYGKLTPERPFSWFNAMNYEDHSVQFGITTPDVATVSLIGPDGSATPAVQPTDGTFIVKTPFAENSNDPSTNKVRVTLRDGKVIEGPFRG
ncbi:hypothetical protein D5S17_07705 [Pseudonocardiaceae bacterium YIM PH 21723]|nr:hypothetical protein D5S17_07705 [Pseudonocardiaceae bacterium YIM PH 21723]